MPQPLGEQIRLAVLTRLQQVQKAGGYSFDAQVDFGRVDGARLRDGMVLAVAGPPDPLDGAAQQARRWGLPVVVICSFAVDNDDTKPIETVAMERHADVYQAIMADEQFSTLAEAVEWGQAELMYANDKLAVNVVQVSFTVQFSSSYYDLSTLR